MTFSVEITVPPSVNGMYSNIPGRGRIMVRSAKRWKESNAELIKAQVRPSQRIGGKVDVLIELPAKMQGDVDNRIKITLDALVLSGRIDDDKHVDKVTARRSPDLKLVARITVTPARAYALAGGEEARA